MKTVIPFPEKARAEKEAADWIVRLDRGELDRNEKTALRDWLAQDTSHQEALTRMAQAWGDMDCMQILSELFPRTESIPRRRTANWLSTGVFGTAATALLVVLILSFSDLIPSFSTTPTPLPSTTNTTERTYRTDLGEQYTASLPDGSIMTLNTQTEVKVRLEAGLRAVYLNRGEAHFDVAKDPGRPFIVHAGQGSVRAVGTAFSVRLIDQEVEVLVTAGVVEVLAGRDPTDPDRPAMEPQGMRVEQGNRIRYTQAINRAEALSATRLERQLAWRSGKWMFEGETLAEVLAEIERYSSQEIIISDAQLAELRVGGYFDIGDVEGFLNAIRASLGVQVVYDNGRYLLHAQPAGDTEEG